MQVYTPTGFVPINSLRVNDVIYDSSLTPTRVLTIDSRLSRSVQLSFNDNSSIVLSNAHYIKSASKTKPFYKVSSLRVKELIHPHLINKVPKEFIALLEVPLDYPRFRAIVELMRVHGGRADGQYTFTHRCPAVMDFMLESISLQGWFVHRTPHMLRFNPPMVVWTSSRKHTGPSVLPRLGRGIVDVAYMGSKVHKHYFIKTDSPNHEFIADEYTIIKDEW